MVNYLETGAELLQQRMEQFAGIEVTYRRSNPKYTGFAFRITAVPGRNPVDIVDANGVVLRGQIQDFVVSIEKMRSQFRGDPKVPVRGDEIEATISGMKIIFLVTGEDFANSHYELADSYGKAWRIHTKMDRTY